MKATKSIICTLAAISTIALGAAAIAADTAEIKGSVKFDGAAPKAKKIKVEADPKCAEMHADHPLMSQEVVVGENGALRYVFVYVKSGIDKVYDAPATPVVIDQKGCHYEPHMFGMIAKQKLIIRNSDPTLHNIHALPIINKEFNIGQPNQGMETAKTFTQPEVMVKFKCDVHPWMSAYVGVMTNPFFAVSDEKGSFSIKGLPAGEYEIEAWHEKYGKQTAKVKVGDGESKEASFSFKPAAE